MNEAPTENTADRRILIKSSPVRCWREETHPHPILCTRGVGIPDPFYARSPFAVIAAGTGHAEGLTGHALARINTQRY